MVGLGVAKSQPGRSVVVITGDGEMLMGFGAIATIALQKPDNLSIVVLDNGHFGETGMQVSHTGRGIELHKVAESCGFLWTGLITDMAGVQDLKRRVSVRDGLKLAAVKIKADNPLRVLPPRDGAYIKNRFRAALGFASL